MRVWVGLFSILISFLLCGCEPLPPQTNANANARDNSAAKNRNANVRENINANSNANENAPANYAQPQPAEKPTAAPSPALNSDAAEIVAVPPLIVPAANIRKQDLRDTFTDSRSEGRSHDAIDIMAAQGTPVLAAADGEIAQFHDSERGGITIYQYSKDKKLIYYYAHLQSRAATLKVGDYVAQGTIIGTVGDTGNAGAGNFHLHFAVWTITDPKRVWEGTNINPYPLLMRAK